MSRYELRKKLRNSVDLVLDTYRYENTTAREDCILEGIADALCDLLDTPTSED
jgi:hypothetical protein